MILAWIKLLSGDGQRGSILQRAQGPVNGVLTACWAGRGFRLNASRRWRVLIFIGIIGLPVRAAAPSRQLVEVFDGLEEGVLFRSEGGTKSQAAVRTSGSTGWGWTAYAGHPSGRARIEARDGRIHFVEEDGYDANIPGAYLCTIFSSKGTGDANQPIDISDVGSVFKIRAESVSSDQALRWMIRDAGGDWFVSREQTWGRRLPVSAAPEHFRTYPVSLYSWRHVKAVGLARPVAGEGHALVEGGAGVPDLSRITGMGIYISRSRSDAPLVISGLGLSSYEPIVYAPPNRATHWFQGPGGLKVGLGELSGGVFNEMYWGDHDPATGKPFNLIPGMNGRAVNFAFRSLYHRGVWNPIQSGHWEEFGRPVDIVESRSALNPGGVRYTWGPVPMPLWHGDGKYDFSQYEDLTYGHPYFGRTPAHADSDSLPEQGLSQEDEVISDFDLSGFYEDMSSVTDGVLALRIVQQADFVRLSGNTRQFNAAGLLIDGQTSVINPSVAVEDISPLLPGKQPSTETDMARIPMIWSDRFDRQIGNMRWLWIWEPAEASWRIVSLDKYRDLAITEETLTVIADSGDPADAHLCRGVGLYYPKWSQLNRLPVVGVDTNSGQIVYEEARLDMPMPVTQSASWRVAGGKTGEDNNISANFTMRSLRINLTGLLSRNHTLVGCHERLRKENFWIFGTPKRILEAVRSIDQIARATSSPLPGKAWATGMPREFFIADGATGVPADSSLVWWPGLRSESSDVYLGTDIRDVSQAERGSSAYRESIRGRSYDAGTLQAGTTYYWRVDSRNGSGVTRGDVWSFTTAH